MQNLQSIEIKNPKAIIKKTKLLNCSNIAAVYEYKSALLYDVISQG